jgi:hypothetical protein
MTFLSTAGSVFVTNRTQRGSVLHEIEEIDATSTPGLQVDPATARESEWVGRVGE